MEAVHKLENMMAGWFKQAPHLPANARKWLADNVWWIVLVGIIVAVIIVLGMLPILLGASVLTSEFAVYAGVDTGRTVLSAWVGFVFLAVVIVLEAMAIAPLKEKKKKGWDLLLAAVAVSVLSSVVGFVITYEFTNIFAAVLTLLIGGYFLFEIRGHFTSSKK